MWPTYFIPPQPMKVEPPPPGHYNNGCGYETYFRPTNIPNLRLGNFMVWICVTNVGRTWSHTAALVTPPGWKIYSADPGYRNANNSGSVIFYKWATLADLSPDTEYVAGFVANPISTGHGYRVCSVTYAYQNIHPEMPFGCANASRGSGSSDWRLLESLFMPIGHDDSPVILLAGSRSWSSAVETWGLQSAKPLGPVLADEARFSLTYSVDVGWNSFYTGRRVAKNTEGENWIPEETPHKSMQAPGWTPFAMTSKLMSRYHVQLRPGGFGSGRHYYEYPVSLIAGEDYTFHLSRRGPWNLGNEGAVGISYVDPSGNERGFISHSGGKSAPNVSVGTFDPLTDLNTVWHRHTLYEGEDGAPSTAGSTPVIHFTAQATGVHMLRISSVISYWNGSTYDYYWVYTASSNQYSEVRGVCFRRGKTPAYFLPTPNGPVIANAEVNGALGSCWDKFAFGNSGVTCPGGVSNHLEFSLNKNVSLNRAVMAHDVQWGDTAGLIDNMTIYPTNVTSDDAFSHSISSRPVMPTIAGVLKKYYFEVTWLNNYHTFLGVISVCSGTGNGYMYNTATGRVNIPNTDNSYVTIGVPVAPVIGDKWGVLIDYVNRQIKFTRNGTLRGTIAMLDTYGVVNTTNSGKTGWDKPLYACIYNNVDNWPLRPGYLTVNLKGPFMHKPKDALAFDWAGS